MIVSTIRHRWTREHFRATSTAGRRRRRHSAELKADAGVACLQRIDRALARAVNPLSKSPEALAHAGTDPVTLIPEMPAREA
jgi:hypothetical protein